MVHYVYRRYGVSSPDPFSPPRADPDHDLQDRSKDQKIREVKHYMCISRQGIWAQIYLRRAWWPTASTCNVHWTVCLAQWKLTRGWIKDMVVVEVRWGRLRNTYIFSHTDVGIDWILPHEWFLPLWIYEIKFTHQNGMTIIIWCCTAALCATASVGRHLALFGVLIFILMKFVLCNTPVIPKHQL